MEPLDKADSEFAAERSAETLKEIRFYEAVIRVYQNLNFITVTSPNVLSWIAGLSAVGVLLLGQNQWAIVSGAASALAALLLGIHQWQGCAKYQEDLSAKLAAFKSLNSRYEEMSKRHENYTKMNLAEIGRELAQAKAMPPVVVRQVFSLIPKREAYGLDGAAA
ncbi:MAG: hypothetical protein AAGA87_08895 [Pseudomonadota bacterium]